MKQGILKAKTPLKANKVPKKRKAPSITLLKRKADRLFSLSIRYRDGEKRDGEWWCQCVTCDSWNPMKNTHAGHFQKRGRLATRWNEENVNAQCLTKESNVRMFNGSNKSIANLVKGDVLWAFNESEYKLREKAAVESVDSFIPDELYEVELEDGSKFWATGDHRVVSNGKWVYIKDMLHNVSTHDILEL